MNVHVKLAWSADEPTIVVHEDHDQIMVDVDPRLSESQVIAACAQLDGIGALALQQWRQIVGISLQSQGPAT